MSKVCNRECIVKIQRPLSSPVSNRCLVYNKDRSLIGEVKFNKRDFSTLFPRDDILKTYWLVDVEYKVGGSKLFRIDISLRRENMFETSGIKEDCEIRKINLIKKVKAQPW